MRTMGYHRLIRVTDKASSLPPLFPFSPGSSRRTERDGHGRGGSFWQRCLHARTRDWLTERVPRRRGIALSLSSPSPGLREDREDRSSFVAEKPDPRDVRNAINQPMPLLGLVDGLLLLLLLALYHEAAVLLVVLLQVILLF